MEGRRRGTYNVSLLVVGQRCAGDQKGRGRAEECGEDDEKEKEAEAAGANVGKRRARARPVLEREEGRKGE